MAVKFKQLKQFMSLLSLSINYLMIPRNFRILLFTVYCLLSTVLCGCASFSQKEPVLAVVDGEPITEEDLKYTLNIAHRREDFSTAGALNLTEYVQKQIDDRLIINEARNSGMDKYPEVQQAVAAYVLRESVVRLHDEEIVQKVSVTEKEIKDYYGKSYENKEFDSVKATIAKEIRKQKEKERGDEYLKALREKISIKIDKELLSEIEPDRKKENTEKWSKDTRKLAEVNSSILTVGDFFAMIKPALKKPKKEDILEKWIDRKAIDHEALRRNYKMDPGFRKMVDRYENQLLKNTYIKRVIIPQIVLTEKNLQDYYTEHQKDFIRPVRFKIQQITVKTMDDAQEILKSLQSGADFSWVAKRRSTDSAASTGGDSGWLTKAELPKPVLEIIDNLQTGEISPVITIDSLYKILRMQDRTGEVIEEYAKVRNNVHKAYVNEQVNTTLNRYIDKLKKDAEIKINEEEIRAIEKKFKQ
jgi:hypothetical protein